MPEDVYIVETLSYCSDEAVTEVAFLSRNPEQAWVDAFERERGTVEAELTDGRIVVRDRRPSAVALVGRVNQLASDG